MSHTLQPVPPINQEIVDAAKSGMLVMFIGAGISRLAGCPSWNGFASQVLNQLTPQHINFHDESLLSAIRDPRKRLSIANIIERERNATIDYEKIFKINAANANDERSNHIKDYKVHFYRL